MQANGTLGSWRVGRIQRDSIVFLGASTGASATALLILSSHDHYNEVRIWNARVETGHSMTWRALAQYGMRDKNRNSVCCRLCGFGLQKQKTKIQKRHAYDCADHARRRDGKSGMQVAGEDDTI